MEGGTYLQQLVLYYSGVHTTLCENKTFSWDSRFVDGRSHSVVPAVEASSLQAGRYDMIVITSSLQSTWQDVCQLGGKFQGASQRLKCQHTLVQLVWTTCTGSTDVTDIRDLYSVCRYEYTHLAAHLSSYPLDCCTFIPTRKSRHYRTSAPDLSHSLQTLF